MAGQDSDGDGDPGARANGPRAPQEPSSDSELAARLQRLEAQIDRKRPVAESDPSTQTGTTSGPSPLGQALRLSTEFTAGVLAGGLLGYLFDRLLGTKPWGLIVLLLLGFVTGIYNVMRASGRAPARPDPGRTRR
jgi:ATP synthase protein I